MLAMEETGDVRYVLRDQQGSKRVVLTGSGAVMARHDYMAYGEEVEPTVGMRDASTQKYGVNDGARQRFAQTEGDQATGLEHTNWRKMESGAGRWTSPDPYRGSMRKDDPQSLNRYAYTQNDPVNFVDPSGLNMAAYWCSAEFGACTDGGYGPGGGSGGGGGFGFSGGYFDSNRFAPQTAGKPLTSSDCRTL